MGNRLVVPSTWELPPEIVARIGDRVGRHRLMERAGHRLGLILKRRIVNCWP